jgi:hypothetical protein
MLNPVSNSIVNYATETEGGQVVKYPCLQSKKRKEAYTYPLIYKNNNHHSLGVRCSSANYMVYLAGQSKTEVL